MKGLLLLWEALCWAFDWWKYWTQKEIFWPRAENVFLVHSTKMCINGSMLLSQLNPHSIYSERKLQNKYFFVTTTKRRMLHRSLHSKSVPVHSLIKKKNVLSCVEQKGPTMMKNMQMEILMLASYIKPFPLMSVVFFFSSFSDLVHFCSIRPIFIFINKKHHFPLAGIEPRAAPLKSVLRWSIT